jgi:hypothetical protein
VYQKKQFTSILPIKKYWLRKAQTSPQANKTKNITAKNFNAIEENFEIKRTFKEILNQQIVLLFTNLKKHYPEIYGKPLVVK